MRKSRRSVAVAILYILVGGIVGSVLGHFLGTLWLPLGRSLVTVGSNPGTSWSLNLGVVGVQLGLWLHLNVLGVIGLIVGLLWFKRSS